MLGPLFLLPLFRQYRHSLLGRLINPVLVLELPDPLLGIQELLLLRFYDVAHLLNDLRVEESLALVVLVLLDHLSQGDSEGCLVGD